jgi:hypothetical protein
MYDNRSDSTHHNKAIILIACVELTVPSPPKAASSDPLESASVGLDRAGAQACCCKINLITLHYQSRHSFFLVFRVIFAAA